MDTSSEQIESLNKNIEQYEQKVRRRAWLFTIIPFLFGVILLSYTVWQLQNYGQKLVEVQVKLNKTTNELATTTIALQDTTKQLDQANTDLSTVQDKLNTTATELKNTQEELKSIKMELEEANQELKNANVFLTNSYSIDPLDEKNSLSNFPYQADVLYYIQQLQYSNVGWDRNGFSEAEGFNSPSFTVYVLQHFGYISGNYNGDAKPWQILEPISQPSIGDIVYYEGGYSMFYFEINGDKFVIGMTPLGIIAQRINFAPILGYLHVPYQ
jgi:outer membrane murein-binding lipoprotein Lpp